MKVEEIMLMTYLFALYVVTYEYMYLQLDVCVNNLIRIIWYA